MSGHGYVSATNRLPDDTTDVLIGNEREDAWGEMPGRIIDFDAAKQTASIQPLLKKNVNGTVLSLPVLIDVPIRFARAGGGAITMPVKAGDHVTLRPSMRSTEAYHTGKGADGYEASPGSSFGLSDMEGFITGGESLADPIKNFDADNLHIRADPEGKFGMRMNEAGKIALEGSDGNAYAILAEFMELIASDELEIKHGSSSGTGHQLQNRAALMELAAKMKAMALA